MAEEVKPLTNRVNPLANSEKETRMSDKDHAENCEQTKPAGYSCWQLLSVKQITGANSTDGCIPVILLPKSLIGKTVKVTIEECT